MVTWTPQLSWLRRWTCVVFRVCLEPRFRNDFFCELQCHRGAGCFRSYLLDEAEGHHRTVFVGEGTWDCLSSGLHPETQTLAVSWTSWKPNVPGNLQMCVCLSIEVTHKGEEEELQAFYQCFRSRARNVCLADGTREYVLDRTTFLHILPQFRVLKIVTCWFTQ